MKLPGRKNRIAGLREFSADLVKLGEDIGFKISSRGWCYLLEGFGLINKAEFDKVENLINNCRRQGYLPIDFTAEEEGRQFSGIEIPDDDTPLEHFANVLRASLRCEDFYTPDWWIGEDYYIQMIVEKIDLKTLFSPVCEQYHIPIATTKGWSSMKQRAEYARRFGEAEERGMKCVLLYCGDYDPDGLRISDFLRKNLADLQDIYWEDGTHGYNPSTLIIKRFGLGYDFIEENNLSWIENLITGSKKNLASPSHKNHFMPYVQEYLKKVGARKCEANALVVRPQEAEDLVRSAIENYLGSGAIKRFEERHEDARQQIIGFREENDVEEMIENIVGNI
ncbi:hypothetical protein LCGC14_0845340 [marine sediment metagenome]|uniref:Uncharacterized protein n=1 Tax=marine sediment metagenome TaxID=412755 RepID=A0A0F9PGS0_9ZZZZ